MTGPLLIADTPWLLYRSFFALPKSIRGADGQPVNALLGTVNALLAAIEARRPRAVVACFGAEQARYRVELYPPYHAHREPMPKELAEQWKRAPELLESFGWSALDAGDLEADDAMASLARVEEGTAPPWRASPGSALLLTADRDLYQAVTERVAVLSMDKGGFADVGPEQVRERYGIAPEQVPDFIALRGDPSDGLPGAPGIGAKTAAELIASYGSLEGALRAAGEDGAMRPRVARALLDNAVLIETFKKVATLVQIDVERPEDRATDLAAGAAAASELGMNRPARRLSSGGREGPHNFS